jgi:hypothetical protein
MFKNVFLACMLTSVHLFHQVSIISSVPCNLQKHDETWHHEFRCTRPTIETCMLGINTVFSYIHIGSEIFTLMEISVDVGMFTFMRLLLKLPGNSSPEVVVDMYLVV